MLGSKLISVKQGQDKQEWRTQDPGLDRRTAGSKLKDFQRQPSQDRIPGPFAAPGLDAVNDGSQQYKHSHANET
jgi:hypothetical protein